MPLPRLYKKSMPLPRPNLHTKLPYSYLLITPKCDQAKACKATYTLHFFPLPSSREETLHIDGIPTNPFPHTWPLLPYPRVSNSITPITIFPYKNKKYKENQ